MMAILYRQLSSLHMKRDGNFLLVASAHNSNQVNGKHGVFLEQCVIRSKFLEFYIMNSIM